MAELCYHKAHYAASLVERISGYSLPLSGTFFQEFVIQCPDSPARINRRLLEQNILGGWDLAADSNGSAPSLAGEQGMLLCVTEMNSKEDIDCLVSALGEFS